MSLPLGGIIIPAYLIVLFLCCRENVGAFIIDHPPSPLQSGCSPSSSFQHRIAALIGSSSSFPPTEMCQTTTKTTMIWNSKNDDDDDDDDSFLRSRCRRQQQGGQERIIEPLLFTSPLLASLIAFVTHQPLSMAFHKLMSTISLLLAGSGGAADTEIQQQEIMNLVQTGLNGPVVTFISILLGTLVANTIGTLHEKNNAVQSAAIELSEEVRTARIYFDTFPARHREQAHAVLDVFVEDYIDLLFCNYDMNLVSLRQLTPSIEDCIRNVHEVASSSSFSTNNDETSAAAVGEAFGALSRIRQRLAAQMVSLQQRFPSLHYWNLVVLASVICLIFLVETTATTTDSVITITNAVDSNNINNFASEPLLALSWAMLVGTFTLLVVVIFDLNRPFAGRASRDIVATKDLDMTAIEQYLMTR